MGCDNKMSHYLSHSFHFHNYCDFTTEQTAGLIFIAVSREYYKFDPDKLETDFSSNN